MQDFDDTIFGNPTIDPNAFVSSRACIVGDVRIMQDVIVAQDVSVRCDEEGPFYIGKGTNLQDGVTIHGLLHQHVEVDEELFSVWIGSHCSITHGAKVHGPAKIGKKTFVGFDAIVHKSVVGRNCFIGFKASIQNSTIGSDCYIGTGAQVENVTIAEGRYVPNGMIIIDQGVANELEAVPPEVEKRAKEFNKEVVDLNKQLVALYLARRRAREKSFRWLLIEMVSLFKNWLAQK